MNFFKKQASVILAFCALVALFAVFSGTLPVLAHHSHKTNAVEGVPAELLQERILLMRHAEKPADEDNPNLAPEGVARAERLPSFIVSRYGRPDFIFASTNSKKSSRPFETALPLSQATGVPVDTSFKDKDFEALANALLTDRRFAGKFIVVFWHHGNIPEFAQALQAKDGSYPEKWKSSVYNQALELDYVGKHHPIVNRVVEDF